MEVKSAVLTGAAMIMLLLDHRNNKMLKRKTSFRERVERLSKTKMFKENRKGKSYRVLQENLTHLGIGVTPEFFNAFSFVAALIAAAVVLVLELIYKLNLISNMEELKEAAKILNDPSLLEVSFNYGIIVITMIIMIILPRRILKLIVSVKSLMEENEVIMLQTYTLMMIKAGKPIKQILVSLMDRSKMFKNILRKAVNTYSKDPNSALREVRESTSNKGFEKTIRALEQALVHDRDVSIIFLRNHRKLTKELKELNRVKKNSMKSIISTLLLIIPLLAFAFIAGYPFLVYSMKMLDNVPI